MVFFRIIGGEIRGPAALSLDENVPNPIPLDRQLHDLMESLGGEAKPARLARHASLGTPQPARALVLQQLPPG